MRTLVYYSWLFLIHTKLICVFNSNEKATESPHKDTAGSSGDVKPHIIIILIDDMGFNDVSFHGSSEIPTANIDALAYSGIILNRLYASHMCTPSRSALLTGKYPIHTGTQNYVIRNGEPWGLPLEETLMPEYFRAANYSTYLVGKWHLGFYKKEMTPMYRGFDHHYGYYSGFIDYFTHQSGESAGKNNYFIGYDFRKDLKPWLEANNTYATELFTDEAIRIINEHDPAKPLFLMISHLAVHAGSLQNGNQALPEDIEHFKNITDDQRRKYAGMIHNLDQSVGYTIEALAKKDMLKNSIILLYSDNGAPTEGIYGNTGSNYPFKGQKQTNWEGGIHLPGLIWSPLLKQRHYVSEQFIHAVDWLPTLMSAANITTPSDRQFDGMNVWDLLSDNRNPEPRLLLPVMDDVSGFSAVLMDNYKLVNGTSSDGIYDKWMGKPSYESDHENYINDVLHSRASKHLNDESLNSQLIAKLRDISTFKCQTENQTSTINGTPCEPMKAPCLFDIIRDPCEEFNIAEQYPDRMKRMMDEMQKYLRSARPSARITTIDLLSDPKRFNHTWHWWYKSEEDNS